MNSKKISKHEKKKDKKQYKTVLKKIIFMLLLLAFIVLFIISGIKIINYLIDSNITNKIMDDISTNIEVRDNEEYNINFKSLKEKNPDTVGFLKVNDTDINHVVVKAKDNDYYLSHDFEKNENVAGWIFVDYRNKLDGTDKNIIIYGHNMKNNNMFGTLKNILNEDWKEKEENRYIKFITEKEESIYEVFSVYEIEAENYYTNTDFLDKTFIDFKEKLKTRSKYNFNVDVKNTNQIITLSTCGNTNKNRVILHAIKQEK